MHFLTAIGYWTAWWLFRPLLWLIRYRVVPGGDDPCGALKLDPAKPICYVLPARSWSELFVLDRVCRDLDLPRPRRTGSELPTPARPACVYLPVLLRLRPEDQAIERVVQSAMGYSHYDAQLVPVSLFWGRDPGEETSLFKLLFADSTHASPLRRLLIILVNGRNLLVSFGAPLSFRGYMGGERDPKRAVRKLARAFHFHFLRARTAALGPTLVRRPVLVERLMASRGVRAAIEAEARDRAETIEQVERRARKVAWEISADYSSASINFLARLLTPVWNRIFKGIEVRGMERVREWAQSHEMIYLPSHRSHSDYLLVSYVLYHAGIVPPHIAAGININFWPVGGLLRRCGAFYMRRSFSGDRVYTAVFRAYVDALIKRGYSISFYPEGGRSRTGRLLPPHTGLLAMVAESALRQRVRPVALVPVYIGYDRVMEGNTYFKELRGAQKRRESAQSLLRATRILTRSYGRAYIAFGEPVRLQDYADAALPGWREQFGSEAQPARPENYPIAISWLAREIMTRVNAAAIANPAGLLACALLASPQKAAAEDDLEAQLRHLIALLGASPYSAEQFVPVTEARAVLDWAAPIARVSRVPHPWGDLIVAGERSGVLLTYYRNNIQHLFALPSLVANFFRTRPSLSEEAAVAGCRALYPFLRTEFFLRYTLDECEAAARDCIGAMEKLGLFARDAAGYLQRPPPDSPAFASLAMLARIMGETLERYAITTLLLARAQQIGGFDRAGFEDDCRCLAERVAWLTGRNAPEFFDPTLFRGYLNTLIEVGLVAEQPDRRLRVEPKIQRVAERALELLGAETQQIILQVLTRRQSAASV